MTLTRRGFFLLALLSAVLAGIAYVPGLPGAFLLDDSFNIVGNAGVHLRSLSPDAVIDAAFSMQQGGLTRILPTLTFGLDHYRAGGLDPATFKTTNIVIHALTVLVLGGFLRELFIAAGVHAGRAAWAALALTLAWGLHPLHVSAVLYVVQRMQTMATLFLIMAMWTYLRARQAQLAGQRGRTGWILSGLLWVLALACKEDAVMLPAYLLAMELTILRFGAADPELARALRRGYAVATLAGVALYLFVVVPHFWSWGAYEPRNFSTYERLLTQSRVLWMYLGQALVFLPSRMPFYYDWLAPSRGLLHPWTTLPALLLLASLLGLAWRLRDRQPLFALGVLLFFAGHFVTSNVVGLELAFEHRNHFPLVGAVMAVGSVLALACRHLRLPAIAAAPACLALLAALSAATVLRARDWNDGYRLAVAHTRIAPQSGRAWQNLCVLEFEMGGGATRENPRLQRAIDACRRGADASADSVTNLTNVIAFKGIQGSLTQADWDEYLARIATATMTPENTSRIWVILDQVRNGVEMDAHQVLNAIDAFQERKPFRPIESAAIGYFILGHTREPGRAYRYFEQAVRTTRDPSLAAGIVRDLRQEGYGEWSEQLRAMMQRP